MCALLKPRRLESLSDWLTYKTKANTIVHICYLWCLYTEWIEQKSEFTMFLLISMITQSNVELHRLGYRIQNLFHI